MCSRHTEGCGPEDPYDKLHSKKPGNLIEEAVDVVREGGSLKGLGSRLAVKRPLPLELPLCVRYGPIVCGVVGVLGVGFLAVVQLPDSHLGGGIFFLG